MTSRAASRKRHEQSKRNIDEMIRRSKPYFELEKQTRLLEIQNNRILVINKQLAEQIMKRDQLIDELNKELELYRVKQTPEEIEAQRQARLQAEYAV